MLLAGASVAVERLDAVGFLVQGFLEFVVLFLAITLLAWIGARARCMVVRPVGLTAILGFRSGMVEKLMGYTLQRCLRSLLCGTLAGVCGRGLYPDNAHLHRCQCAC